MLAKNFTDALRIEQENDARAAKKRAELESAGGVDKYRDSLEILPLVTDREYDLLSQMWARVPHGKFDDLTARGAVRLGINKRDQALYARVISAFTAAKEITGTNPMLNEVEAKLKAYHGLLKSLFPCPGEVDPISVFRDIATKGNFDPSMRRKVGPFRDHSLMLRDPKTGEILGGIDFCVYTHKDGPATVQTNFTFLKPEYRNMKCMNRLLQARDEAVLSFLQKNKPEALKHGGWYDVTEQNVPELLGGRTYILDKAHSMDPITRLRIWGAQKYARLNFHYVQPKLAPGEPTCEYLSLNASFRRVAGNDNGEYRLAGAELPTEMPALTLQNHLKAFYTQSIDHVRGDNTAKTIVNSLNEAVKNGTPITTVPHEKMGRYLDLWEGNVKKIIEVMPDKRLKDDVTIGQLYQQVAANENRPAVTRAPRRVGATPRQ